MYVACMVQIAASNALPLRPPFGPRLNTGAGAADEAEQGERGGVDCDTAGRGDAPDLMACDDPIASNNPMACHEPIACADPVACDDSIACADPTASADSIAALIP